MLGRFPATRSLDVQQRLKAHSVQLSFGPVSRDHAHKQGRFTLLLMSNCPDATENSSLPQSESMVQFGFFFVPLALVVSSSEEARLI